MERTADLQEHLTHPAAADAALSALAPSAAAWFCQRFGGPTTVQRLAWPALASGRCLLLSAPTGAGKTLAAFLPILGRLCDPAVTLTGASVRCLYVAPLKALSNDIARSLSDCLDGLSAFLPEGATTPRLAVRTGDTSGPERQALRHDPPDMLLTTPESLAVLLSQPALHPVFAGLRWVVVDEVHALAPTKRGADLALSLERLSALATEPIQRIGLSATAAPLAEAARFLTGMDRPCAIAEVREESPLDLRVTPLADGPAFLADLLLHLVPEVRACRATLVFTNTRRLAERLAWALRHRLPDWDDQIAVHHSSVAAGRRRDVEARFKQGRLRVVVSSTSLELGIDVGSVDLVALVHPPGGVVRLLQRSAGRGTDQGACGAAWCSRRRRPNCWRPSSPPPRAGRRSASRCRSRATHSTCCASSSRAWRRPGRGRPTRRSPWPAVLTPIAICAGKISTIASPTSTAWTTRAGRGCRRAYAAKRGTFSIRDERTARLLRRNLGTILAEERVAVLAPFSRDPEESADPSWIDVGDVDQAFADRLQPGDRFLLDGRCLEFRRREGESVFVEEVAGRPATPRWGGDGWPLSPDLARRLFLLRGQAADALRDGPTALAELLRRDYGLEEESAALLNAYFQRQECVSEIPDAASLLIEEVICDQGADYYLHTPLNRRGNDALARVAVHRMARDRDLAASAVVADLGLVLHLRAALDEPPTMVRAVLDAARLDDDLETALAEGPALRQRFGRTALTGLMLLRNPLGRGRRVGGRDWGERRLFDQVQARDADFALLRQAAREIRADLCDLEAARHYAVDLARRPIHCRPLSRPSPFAEGWTQAVEGPAEPLETPAEVLRRLHAALTGIND